MTVPGDTASVDVVERLRAAGCVFAEDEARLLDSAASTAAELESMVVRRVAGEPLEYIVGWVDFCGLRIAVTPGVFVPRQRTALLVREAAGLTLRGSVVVDLCCGCGAIGVAVDHIVGGVELHAADVDPIATRCARGNVAAPGRVYTGDLFAPLPASLRGQVTTVVANVPYVPSAAIATMPSEARDHEPHTTLDGGPDGLDVLRRVASEAPDWLAPGGHLLVETGENQAAHAARALARCGFDPRIASDGEIGATVVVGSVRPPARS